MGVWINGEVASGIYFYNITAGDFSATKKMIVRKMGRGICPLHLSVLTEFRALFLCPAVESEP